MRLSAIEGDPGFHPDALPARVFFEGAEVRDVCTADEEKRLIVQIARDGNGVIVVEGGVVKKVTRFGHVRIEPKYEQTRTEAGAARA